MALCQKPVYVGWRIASLFVTFVFVLSACGGGITPTATVVPTPTLEPTSLPTPVHILQHTISPDIEEVQAGDSVRIALSFDPPVAVKDIGWEFVVGSGTIDPPNGSDVIVFTAPAEKGNVIIAVGGTTVDGASFGEKFTFSVVLPPTPTPLPPCSFTSVPIAPPLLKQSSLAGTIVSPARCENKLPVGTAIPVNGTAGDIPENVHLWLLALARNGLYYPQCNDATKGLCSANYNTSAGTWSVPVYLGDRAYPNCKERYYLVLVAVDPSGNDTLIEEMKKAAQENKYGIAPDDLPKSIEELASVEVETAGGTKSCP